MRSVDDRFSFLQRAFLDQKAAPFLGLVDRNRDGRLDWRDLAVESERVRLLEDRDGDGRAERSEIFAQDFNTAVTGIGAGLLAHGGDVFFTCLPDLWRLREVGAAVQRDALLTGFGVHITYSGHDLHGLAIGPDGRLYWTVGDCGARITTKEGRVLDVADTGAVFRANPDGSECEIVMRGLRNPVELCFNDVGDLFTADNNADGGDLARWVHVVEGGDAGWQIGWQALPGLGAWNSERLWMPEIAQSALALIPPVGTLGHGPAGIAFYPGTGLPEVWRDHFFVCDFPGGVRAFQLRPHGASYTIAAPPGVLHDNSYTLENKLVWGFYPTDVEFGPGGGVFVLDWVRDVEKPGKGRIFRLHDSATDATTLVRETQELLAADLRTRPAEELARLLGHADCRVRLAAQFALAGKNDAATLSTIAGRGGSRLERLHAIWGLGQLGRRSVANLAPCRDLLRDEDSEVRARARVLVRQGWRRRARAHRRSPIPSRERAPRPRAWPIGTRSARAVRCVAHKRRRRRFPAACRGHGSRRLRRSACIARGGGGCFRRSAFRRAPRAAAAGASGSRALPQRPQSTARARGRTRDLRHADRRRHA